MKLNDLVSFIRFSLNRSAHIKISGPINRLSLFSRNAHCQSIDGIFSCNGNSSHTTDTKLRRLLNFKTRTVTECGLLPTASPLTETGNKKNLQGEIVTQNY